MAQVFLSWGSPDLELAKRVSEVLRNAGLEVWDSMHDMAAGDVVHSVVLQEIAGAQVALFLLSEQVVTRPWVQRELDWCFAEHHRKGALKILPVQVGPLSTRPELIEDLHLNIDDLSEMDDDGLNRLVGTVRASLGVPEPIIVPAALYAMTDDDFPKLSDAAQTRIARLCATAGMPPPAMQKLKERYGKTPDDFKPFGGVTTLREIVERTLYMANSDRPQSEQPVLLRWCREGLKTNDKTTLDYWSSQHSLLFVDSVSLERDDIKLELLNLPWPVERSRSLLVWIPPHTQYTTPHRDGISESVAGVRWLWHAFKAFEDVTDTSRQVVFDVPSQGALNQWLFRMLSQKFALRPSSQRLESMRRFREPPALLPRRDFNRGAPRS